MNSLFLRDFQFATLRDLDRFQRLIRGSRGHFLYSLDDVVAFNNFSKDDVASIEPAK